MVAFAVLVYQQLEKNILTPRIQGKAVNVSAFFIIVVSTSLGARDGSSDHRRANLVIVCTTGSMIRSCVRW